MRLRPLVILGVLACLGAPRFVAAQEPVSCGPKEEKHEGHQHINDGAAAAGFVAAGFLGALAGSAARSTDHYLEVEYLLPDGSASALLLRLHKENQQEIIDTMHAATGIEK